MFTTSMPTHVFSTVKHYLQPVLPDYEEAELWAKMGLEDILFQPYLSTPENIPKAPAADKPFTVSSWNIQFGVHIDDILHAIVTDESLRTSDVIALQEVTRNDLRTGKRDLPREIADATGLFSFYGISHLVEHTGSYGGEIGNMLLSRYPMHDPTIIRLRPAVDIFRMSREELIGGRIAVRAAISAGNRDLTIYCTHLEAYTSPKNRLSQLSDIFEDAENYTHSNVIIAGDFNFGPFESFNRNGYQAFYDPIGNGNQSTINGFFGRMLRLKLDRIISNTLIPLEWAVHTGLPHSDHFPITVTYTQ